MWKVWSKKFKKWVPTYKNKRTKYAKFFKNNKTTRGNYVWKTATKAAQNVLKQESDPLYSTLTLGQHNDLIGWGEHSQTSGVPQNVILLGSGVAEAIYRDNIVNIVQPPNSDNFGNKGTRKDKEIQIHGIRIRTRIFIPSAIRTAKFTISLGIAKEPTKVDNTLFRCPDNFTMIRDDQTKRENMRYLRILKTQNCTLTQQNANVGNTATSVYKDVDLYYKFKKPHSYKYTGPLSTDNLNEKFCINFSASYQYPAGNFSNQLCGIGCRIITYYRDL